VEELERPLAVVSAKNRVVENVEAWGYSGGVSGGNGMVPVVAGWSRFMWGWQSDGILSYTGGKCQD
jgi:hypothetical protein